MLHSALRGWGNSGPCSHTMESPAITSSSMLRTEARSQPGPGRRGEPDAVELHHLIREQCELMSYDVDPPRCAESPPPGEVDAPVLVEPAGQRGVPEAPGRSEAKGGLVVEVGISAECSGSCGAATHGNPDAAGDGQEIACGGPGPGDAGLVGGAQREGPGGQVEREWCPAHGPLWLSALRRAGDIHSPGPPCTSSRHFTAVLRENTAVKCQLEGGGEGGWGRGRVGARYVRAGARVRAVARASGSAGTRGRGS